MNGPGENEVPASSPAASAAAEQPAPEALPPQQPARHGRAPHLLATLQSVMTTIIVVIFVVTFIVQAFRIPSESMQDTLLVGDFLLVDKAHYGHASRMEQWFMPYQPIRRQDVVVFRYPVNPSQHFVKRVIGVPGDHLRLQNKKVFINGKPLQENYARLENSHDPYRDNFPNGPSWTYNMEAKWAIQKNKLVEDGQLIVPEHSYFVMGDNRDDSSDSRLWGFVPEENIIGTPLVIYWSMETDALPGQFGHDTGDKLSNLTYLATHILRDIRWGRMLRVVR